MSVEELRFKQEFEIDGQKRVNKFKIYANPLGHFSIEFNNGKELATGLIKIGRYRLDRSQAHLLMLYLQEHLSYDVNIISKAQLDPSKINWRCSCGRYHDNDYVCPMLK